MFALIVGTTDPAINLYATPQEAREGFLKAVKEDLSKWCEGASLFQGEAGAPLKRLEGWWATYEGGTLLLATKLPTGSGVSWREVPMEEGYQGEVDAFYEGRPLA